MSCELDKTGNIKTKEEKAFGRREILSDILHDTTQHNTIFVIYTHNTYALSRYVLVKVRENKGMESIRRRAVVFSV